MAPNITSIFIDKACQELEYNKGDLIDVSANAIFQDNEKGDWLKLCDSLNDTKEFKTEKIFFVNDEPVIIFSKTDLADNLYEIYNRIWCMARPRLLYIESPTTFYLLDLAKQPFKDNNGLINNALVIVTDILDVKNKLNEFRREQIESGKIFEDEKFSDIEFRADHALIRDLKIVRNKLDTAGLKGKKIKYAHALIGKSIFIRYLEDRGILSSDYFYDVAKTNKHWTAILETTDDKVYLNEQMKGLLYPKVLLNKDFTYAFYQRIAKDFNGDIFPTDDLEEKIVSQNHLTILHDFLNGAVDNSNVLFFWAYHFDIIPIELISNIYEEFYHHHTRESNPENERISTDTKGTYYTPVPLVEFLLKRTLNFYALNTKPRILDPACGSGIFLVQAFRKIVRYNLFIKEKKALTRNELLQILKNQIGGIELNEEAIKIAAFSLYLAFLHYQSPPDILLQIKKGKRLPHLIFSPKKKRNEEYYDILLQANAFETYKIENTIIQKKFVENCADIIIGNPPWGSPPTDDEEARKALKTAIDWCDINNYPTSDKERSQAFIWRAINLLKPNGIAGLLVSSGILLKQSAKSNIFKDAWLNSITLKEVANFIHVRDVFFNGAISPFLSIVFKKSQFSVNDDIDYWTLRRTRIIENTKAVIVDKTDFKFLSYTEAFNPDIWKIFYFGNHRDFSLIKKLRLQPQLSTFEFIPEDVPLRRQGFIEGKNCKKVRADWLKEYKELPASKFDHRYNAFPFSKILLDVPHLVKERGSKHIFEGKRLLIGKVSQKTDPKGLLIVRLESKKFSFRNTINCIKLEDEFASYYELILGILWSSLSRYYFFLTVSKWGVWHDQIYADEIASLPIALPKNSKLHENINAVVSQLKNQEFKSEVTQQINLFSKPESKNNYAKTCIQLEEELDNLIFKLYNLSNPEINLVKDRCSLDIDFFYRDSDSIAVSKLKNLSSQVGDISTLQKLNQQHHDLFQYLNAFLNVWEKEIEDDKKFTFKVIYPHNSPLIAIVFDLKKRNSNAVQALTHEINVEWNSLLNRLETEMKIEYSRKIYIDGILRIVTKSQIIIIKRNERRLWTITSAFEDADATLLQAMINQENHA